MTGDEEDFNERRQEILNEWAEKRETSCLRGSAIHKEHTITPFKADLQKNYNILD